MRQPRPTTVDVETFGIQGRPDYPPRVVGVSVKPWGRPSKYYAFGHVGHRNPHTEAQARAAVEKAYACPDGVLFHNAKFDADCIEAQWGLAVPPWDRVHDTTFALFLDDPNQRVVALKPAAARLLGWPPGERDAVKDWLLANQPVPGVRIGKGDSSKEPWGKYIAYAPPALVGPYACGDTDRTEAIFAKLWPSVAARSMLDAYDRERKLMPILLAMERQGVPVDVARLRRDVALYADAAARVDAWTARRLGVTDPDFNAGSPDQLVAALAAAGLLDESRATFTKTGKVSTAKGALDACVSDAQLSSALRYRAALGTCLETFMRPWLATTERSGGLIFTTWNQIRGEGGGTRTGRLSSSPNFQNIPKEFAPLFLEWALADAADEDERRRARKLPKLPWKTLPRLPMCRSYVVPHAGHALVGRDFSQQEPRILAHFEDGPLMRMYLDDPWTDMHDHAKDHLVREFRRPFARRPVKNINLGLIYGQGIASLAERNGWDYDETKRVFGAILGLYPGLDALRKDMKRRASAGVPARTWGGREFFCEPPAIVDGRICTFDYKMVNTLVQGSAADDTKEAMVRLAERMVGAERFARDIVAALAEHPWKLLLQVHDELVMSVPLADVARAHDAMRETMESVEFDVKVLTEGAWSRESWGAMTDYDRRGVVVAVGLPDAKRGARRAA